MSKNYNQTLQSNNTDLQAILDAIHELPEAGSGGSSSDTDNFIEEDIDVSYTNNSAKRIGSYKFYCHPSLEEVSFSSCISIGEFAFYDCTELTSINLPACEEIGVSGFEYCTGLQAVSLPSCKVINSCAFTDCNALISLTLGGNEVVTLRNIDAFWATGIQVKEEGRIYVPAHLVEAYKTATNWSSYANKITAI